MKTVAIISFISIRDIYNYCSLSLYHICLISNIYRDEIDMQTDLIDECCF